MELPYTFITINVVYLLVYAKSIFVPYYYIDVFFVTFDVKIAVVSHIVLDCIENAESSGPTKSLGGPACYCGLTAKNLGFEVILATRVGKDFPQGSMNIIRNDGLIIKEAQVTESPTTRFKIILNKDCRELFLISKCSPLTLDDVEKIQTDSWLVSPVIDEVPAEILAAIVKDRGKKNFVMLDPQGYMRVVSLSSGRISFLDNLLSLDLSGITAIKADKGELAALTGGLEGLEGMQFLQSTKGIKFVIFNDENRTIHLLHNKIHYWIKLRDIDTPDSTGAGDILSAAFCCTYLKENDPLWAICFGAGAVRAALETKLTGLNKLPSKATIEQNASYYYGTIEFQRL
jgi:sugar/nucleoside kinase (ribokinase family)